MKEMLDTVTPGKDCVPPVSLSFNVEHKG